VNWAEFPSYNDSWIEALKLFLRFYAFEHRGAPLLYKEEAAHAVENCKDTLNTEKASRDVWEEFKRRCLGKVKGPASKCNPLNPEGTRYCDAVTFCKRLPALDNQNLYLFCLRKLKSNNVLDAHIALSEIRGVKTKIASLFLRDIALKNGILDTGLCDRGLLQPIDVWLRRTAQMLTGGSNLEDRAAAQQLIRLADEARCSALCLNAGSWYFGSQVARTEQQYRDDLQNPQSFKRAIERHRAAKKTSPAQTPPKATKPKRESLASHLTAFLVQGGHIEEIRDEVNAHADRLGVKKITAGRVRAHAKWRSSKGAYTVKEDTSGFIQMVPAARPKVDLSTARTSTDRVNALGQSGTAPMKGD
jgi:hypothetical protein